MRRRMGIGGKEEQNVHSHTIENVSAWMSIDTLGMTLPSGSSSSDVSRNRVYFHRNFRY